MSASNQRIIFDANFFICMNAIKAKDILGNLNRVAQDLAYKYYISDVVFNEVKAPDTFKENFKQFINIEKINDSDIEKVKNELAKYNIRFPAQDNDLSLVGIGKKLLDEDNSQPVHLVTDDYKLAKNASLLYRGKLNILSLSSFLLKIQQTATKAQMRTYFKDIWKKSLNYTLSYMIERSKTYNMEEKLIWVIERAVSVTEDSIITKDCQLTEKTVKFEIGATKYPEEIAISEKYIENQNITSSEDEKVRDIINFLENLKISREYVNQARDAIIKNDSKNAVKYLKKGNVFLVSLLQLASGQLKKLKDYEIVETLICSEISKMEFLRSFLLVSLNRVNTAIDSLERAALFSTIIHNFETCLTLNYLKALIQLFHGLYNSAISQYSFTEQLADIYEDERLKLKCLIGKAIALYIQSGEENKNTAMNIMEEISNMDLDKNFLDAVIVYTDLGDYFLALGHSQIATNLYNQALEISIDYKLTFKSDILIEKLKRAYIATVISGYSAEDIVDKLDVLLDKAYSVKDVEKYNEQIKKISSFNILFYTPFEYIKGKKKILPFSQLPKELQEDYLEVVHFEKLTDKENQILFIVSHYELGLLGIKLQTDDNITGIAENYSLKIKPTAKVKIYEPDEILKDTYLIRAIIEITTKNQCEITYTLPSFFKQLNL